MKNTFRTALNLTLFGESHGPAVGAVIDGLAPGIAIDEAFMRAEMDKRRAVDELSTPRREADEVEFLSGVYGGYTTGTPLCLIVKNQNTKSGDYAKTKNLLRPGHADYTALQKYLGYADPRGGGHFSGRLTAPLVAAGAIFRSILAARGITVGTHLARCGTVADAALPQNEEALAAALSVLNQKRFAVLSSAAGEEMKAAILQAKNEGDSLGGILETAIVGLPAGVGEPFFDTLESVLASLFFAIPGVKGVEFGLGFGFAKAKGSEVNDAFTLRKKRVKTATNNNGGVNGGIANGMPVVLRAVVKPTPSIAKVQQTVDMSTHTEATLEIHGRHDPCILPRARAVADAMAAFGILDLCCQRAGTLWQREGFDGGI